jgi:type III secretion protein R
MDVMALLPTFVLVSAFLSLVPFLAVAASCFTKITIVLLIIRNALGIQQTPANIVLYSAGLILTFYVMSPVMQDVYAIVAEQLPRANSLASYERMFKLGAEPVREFLKRFADENSRVFFLDSLEKIWPNAKVKPTSTDLAVLVPSFLASELTRAFQIGFLLYLPFVMVDIVVSAILIALGMQQMSPTIISTPLKLLLFVAVDGWNKLFQGLVLSYAA